MSQKLEWVAYCTTCQATMGGYANGPFAEAEGRFHMRKNPGHHVILGYWVCAHLHQTQQALTAGGSRWTCLACGYYEDTPPQVGEKVFRPQGA